MSALAYEPHHTQQAADGRRTPPATRPAAHRDWRMARPTAAGTGRFPLLDPLLLALASEDRVAIEREHRRYADITDRLSQTV